jgi:hypothetical protein
MNACVCSFKSFAKRRRQRDSDFGQMRGDVGAAPDGSIIDEQASLDTMKMWSYQRHLARMQASC